MQEDRMAYRVAAVQAAPVLPMNKEATIEKVCDLLREAAGAGADLVVFPETFVPMFPNFSQDLNNAGAWQEFYTELVLNSIEADGEELRRVAKLAAELDVHVVLGFNERVSPYVCKLYNSQAFIDNRGNILGTRRKLIPSNREKAIWTAGDGCDIQVHRTSLGMIGGLICYENLQPILKYAHMVQGQQIHCASWPGWPEFGNGRTNRHVIDAAARQYALEGQCFVIIASLYIPPEAAPKDCLEGASWEFFGGSGIVSPSGEYVAGPVYGQETIVYGEVDLTRIIHRKTLLDISGKDQRWDIFKLHIVRERATPFVDRSGAPLNTPATEERFRKSDSADEMFNPDNHCNPPHSGGNHEG